MRVMCFVFLVFQIVWKLCAGTNKSHKIRYKIRLVPRSFLCDNWIWIPSCTEIAQCPGVITTCSLSCVRQIRHFDGSNCRGHCVASVKWMGALKLPRPPVLYRGNPGSIKYKKYFGYTQSGFVGGGLHLEVYFAC